MSLFRRHRRRPLTDWTGYVPMPERFLHLRAWGELATEEAQFWFDELFASKEERISQVAALMARNGLDTSDPTRLGFWREVTLWLDEHAEYDAALVGGHSDASWGIPWIWCAVGADIDWWYAAELIRRSEGKYQWILPLDDDYSTMFQTPCYQNGMWGHPSPVMGCAINFAYSDYSWALRPRAIDLQDAMNIELARPTPGRPVIVEDDDVDEYGLSAEERAAYDEAWLAEQPDLPPKPPKKWIR